jgi:hypothetical protein
MAGVVDLVVRRKGAGPLVLTISTAETKDAVLSV